MSRRRGRHERPGPAPERLSGLLGRRERHGTLTGWAALARVVDAARQQQADLNRACYTPTPDLRSAS
ncbi:hypothetical protein [Herbidospora daliensis]|uniref:hypothetical protein n=1 Tax=Herbidospora daliensis TaxID=295585 RepID=UPI000780BE3D|nr:hypothetical protein [Herbidospora daliensis]